MQPSTTEAMRASSFSDLQKDMFLRFFAAERHKTENSV